MLDGEAVAQEIRHEVASGVADRVARGKTRPRLAVILAGEDEASRVYVRNKIKACGEVGIESELIRLEGSRDDGRTLPAVLELNRRSDVDGILVQLPLPEDADETRILHALDPGKDVDGLHPENVGRLVEGTPGLRPCTPSGILELLRRSAIGLEGSHAVVVGRSNIVGKPMALLLLQANATVTICHSATADIGAHTRQADIVVVATGRRDTLRGDMLKPGAIVIDVGINRNEEGKLCGDVDFASVAPLASFITPVPGGVGPMTITMLLMNTIESAERVAG